MISAYTVKELDEWIAFLVKQIDNGTLNLRPNDTVLQITRPCVDAVANLLKFRRGIHTIEVSPQFAVNTSEWIDYENFPVSARLNDVDFARVAFDGKTNNDSIYLYNDGCKPTKSAEDMKAYLDRLAMLGGLQFARA